MFVYKPGDPIELLVRAIKERERQEGFLDRLKGLILTKKAERYEINPNALVVAIDPFRQLLHRIDARLDSYFREAPLVLEQEIVEKLQLELSASVAEVKLALLVLQQGGQLSSLREKGQLYYFRGDLDENERMAFFNGVLLDRQIQLLNLNLDQLHQADQEKRREALRLKKAGRKAEALKALTSMRLLQKGIEETNHRLLMLEDMKMRIATAIDHKEFANVLRQVNDYMRRHGNQSDSLLDNIASLKEHEDNQEAIARELAGAAGTADLEEMYKELSELGDKPAVKVTVKNAEKAQPAEAESIIDESLKKADGDPLYSKMMKDLLEHQN